MTTLHNPAKLRSDVDFVYSRLRKLHPRLYQYTGKWVLDFKFDSLKSSITSPMTSNEFFFKLSPVIAEVRQGHVWLEPMVPKMKTGGFLNPGLSGRSPLSAYDLEMFDNRLYLFRNYTGNQTLKPGTEVVTLNGQYPADLVSKFRPTTASDGFNQTFIQRKMDKWFPTWYYYQNGMAGEILQKFSNYRIRLSIVGDFSKYTRKSIQDFIFESNKMGQITFTGSVKEALECLIK